MSTPPPSHAGLTQAAANRRGGHSGTLAQSAAVVVVDDHEVVHAGVQQWLAGIGIRTLGWYRSADDFLDRHDATGEQRVLVVYDPEIAGQRPNFAALETICTSGHSVLVYSGVPSHEVILTCLDRGALGYVMKSDPRQHLIDAVVQFAAGRSHVTSAVAAASESARRQGRPRLSKAEQRVILTWFHCRSKAEVALRLHIARSTVLTHLQRGRSKYAAVGRPAPEKASLFARAVQDGLIGVHEL